MTIHKKLLKIQRELKAPKKHFNEFGNFHYRSLEDIIEAAKPLMAEAGVVLLLSDEVCQVGNRFYVKATATLVDIESGDSVSAFGLAREIEKKTKMDDAQVTGASSSYARKYALCGLFAIDGQDDADFTATDDEPARTNQQENIQETQSAGKNQTNQSGSQGQNPTNNPTNKGIKIILGKQANFLKEGPLGFRTAQFEDKQIGWVMTINEGLTEKLASLKAGLALQVIGEYLPEDEKGKLPADVRKGRVFMITDIGA